MIFLLKKDDKQKQENTIININNVILKILQNVGEVLFVCTFDKSNLFID